MAGQQNPASRLLERAQHLLEGGLPGYCRGIERGRVCLVVAQKPEALGVDEGGLQTEGSGEGVNGGALVAVLELIEDERASLERTGAAFREFLGRHSRNRGRIQAT